jgi:CRISPR/Cas system CSM-associated protein Csm4 (group 5 of RAMP superfamily)
MKKYCNLIEELSKNNNIKISHSLMTRLFEFFREEKTDDIILHHILENMNKISKKKSYLDMDDYENIVNVKKENFKSIEELLSEEYYGDSMTLKELKIAINSAKNIIDMLENGMEIERWQISAIVKASDELASVCTSMRTDVEDDCEEDEFGDEYTTGMYEAANKLVAKYVNDGGGRKISFKIYETPQGKKIYSISNHLNYSLSASNIDLKSSHATAAKNIEQTISHYEKGGDSAAIAHLNKFTSGWKKTKLVEDFSLEEDDKDGRRRNGKLLAAGLITRDEYDKRQKLGKYRVAGPRGTGSKQGDKASQDFIKRSMAKQ